MMLAKFPVTGDEQLGGGHKQGECHLSGGAVVVVQIVDGNLREVAQELGGLGGQARERDEQRIQRGTGLESAR